MSEQEWQESLNDGGGEYYLKESEVLVSIGRLSGIDKYALRHHRNMFNKRELIALEAMKVMIGNYHNLFDLPKNAFLLADKMIAESEKDNK